MDTISISTLATLAGKWQAEADAHVTSPSTYGTARRETLRECADVLRGLCDSCECPPARAEFVTLGGGLPGDPNGEHAALAVEGLVRKYEGAMLRETLREALSEAYLMGAQNILGQLR